MNTSITKLSNDFFRIFTDKTLLFLVEHGWDIKYGGLFETLDSQGKNGPEDFRRVMVHARQLFVFSRWTRVTGDKAFERMADKIFEYLTASFWDADYGGWCSRVALDGKPLDFTKDLYAHAFVLFGLLHYAEYIKKNEAEAWIEKTITVLQQRFLRSDGSYKEQMNRYFSDMAGNQRSQNPHMHLLEAALALSTRYESSQYNALVASLSKLFDDKFLDRRKLIIHEYLNNSFYPDKEIGHIIEPGHHYEWAWLLNWTAETLNQPELRGLGARILSKSLEFGWDFEFDGVFDQVNATNLSILKNSKRLWPILELIKALCVYPNERNLVYLKNCLETVLEHYLKETGTWIERYTQDWQVLSDKMPVSSAYHLGMACLELEKFNDS